jgi:hypothetical protein
MTTTQIAAHVEHARKDGMIRRLALPRRPGSAPGLVVLACLGIAAALVLGYALAGAL